MLVSIFHQKKKNCLLAENTDSLELNLFSVFFSFSSENHIFSDSWQSFFPASLRIFTQNYSKCRRLKFLTASTHDGLTVTVDTGEGKDPALSPCSTDSTAFVLQWREQLYFNSAAKMFFWHTESKSKDSDNLTSSLTYPWAEKRPGVGEGTGCPPFSTQELGLL